MERISHFKAYYKQQPQENKQNSLQKKNDNINTKQPPENIISLTNLNRESLNCDQLQLIHLQGMKKNDS